MLIAGGGIHNNWHRRQVWNLVKARLKVTKKSSLVIVLSLQLRR